MTQPNSVDEFLFGGAVPRAKLKRVGDEVTGKVTGVTKEAAPDFDQKTNQRIGNKTFGNGDPIFQLRVRLQTTQRDTEIEDDDGQRILFISGRSTKNPGSTLDALRFAIKASGAKSLEIGGTLTMKVMDGIGTPSEPLVYTATWVRPVVEVQPDAQSGDPLA